MTEPNDNNDEPIRLVLCPGISVADLIAQIRSEYWRGLPILPPGHEVQIIPLGGRVEPDIEDEP